MNSLNTESLTNLGLNLQAVVNLTELTPSLKTLVKNACVDWQNYRQLILLGHGGKKFWQVVKQSEYSKQLQNNTEKVADNCSLKMRAEFPQNPIDDFCREKVINFFSSTYPENQFKLLFPQARSSIDNELSTRKEADFLGLQQLGELVGWHFDSPFKVGINATWGSWFAYRALVIADTHFTSLNTHKISKSDNISPCLTCYEKPCIEACPPKAMSTGKFELELCLGYRKKTDSACRDRCLARMACPVAASHQYSLSQIQYHYGHSMQLIKLLEV